MADGRGGYRQPSNPAAVSGPGSMSRRTDGGTNVEQLGDAYGEQTSMRDLRRSSPVQPGRKPTMAPGRGGGAQGGPVPGVTPFSDPTQAPGQPVTAGAPVGAGPGPEVLGLPMNRMEERKADVRSLPPGMIQDMVAASMRADALPSFRRMVKLALANR